MQKRLIAVVGGLVVVASALAGCSASAEADAFAAGVRSHGVGGSELKKPVPLVMPHRAVTLMQSVVSSTLDEGLATDLGLGDSELDAAGGSEFVAVSFTVDEPPYEDDGGEARVNVVTDDAAHDITEIVVAQPDPEDEIAVVVSVPVDSPVTLEIADQGKTASLDLRTGELSEQTLTDSTGAYYPASSAELSGALESAAVVGPADPANAAQPDSVSIGLSLSQAHASVNGWIPGVDWAPSGQTFVVVADVIATLHFGAGLCGVGWDPATSMTFTPDGGTPVPATGFGGGEYFTRGDFAFAVPRGTTAGTLSLAPQTTVSSNCQLVQPFPAASVPITL